jgi:hypothetical protein
MNTNSSTLLNHFEVFYNTILTSRFRRVIRFRGNKNQQADDSHKSIVYEQYGTISIDLDTTDNTPISSGDVIYQAISTIIVWIILGFATGFLLGMI